MSTRVSSKKSRRRPPVARARSTGTLRLALVLGVLVFVNLYVFLWRKGTSVPAVMEQAALAGAEVPTAGQQGPRSLPARFATSARQVLETEAIDGRWVEGAVKDGDSLGRILRREGLAPPEADEVIRAIGEHMDLRSIRPGQDYRVRFDGAGNLLQFDFVVSKKLTVRARRAPDGVLVGEKDEIESEIRVNELGGTIRSSLYAAIKDSGEDTSLVSFFVDVFAFDLNFFTDTHEGDTFRMIVEKEFVAGEFIKYKRVLGAEYAGKAGTFRAFYYTPTGSKEGRYYLEGGESVEKTFLKTPLKFVRVSSGFNPSRMHPVLHTKRGHMGVDYAAPTGTPIWAAASGKIVGRSAMGGAGNCVILQHDNGLQTIYMHLSKFRQGQKVGQRVKQKEVIGYVGTTGLSTGPHLHFGVKKNGKYVDPMKLKMSRAAGISKKEMPAFKAATAVVVEHLSRIAVDGSATVPGRDTAELDEDSADTGGE